MTPALTVPRPATKVAVVIVNWNGGDLLARCLDALLAQTRPADRILVVDNDSQDGSWEIAAEIAARHPAVHCLRLPLNLGFAAANNLAVRQLVDMDWIALLNPDAFAEPTWLAELLAYAEGHPDCAAIGSCQLDGHDPQRLDGTGDIYHASGKAWRDNQGRSVADWQAAGNGDAGTIFSPCGAAALYRRAAFLAVGGFDEAFFCYMEDVDLGARLQLAGYTVGFAPRAVVHHLGSATSGGADSRFAQYYGHRNLVWVYAKVMPWPLWLRYLPQHLLLNLADLVYFCLRGRGATVFRAKWDALRGLPAMLRQRHTIQRRAVLSAAAFDQRLAHGTQRPYLEKLARANGR